MADTDQVLNLAAIIRKVDGNHSKGAAALAESILDHPRFRAVLAGEPAVPEGREPAAVTGQPSDEELLKLAQQCSVVYLLSDGSACHPFQEGYDMRNDVLNFARAVLARWGNPAPQPPADGEVAELVAWLRETGDTIQPSHLAEHQRYKRAAELLERLSPPQPVPVGERLPEPSDCAPWPDEPAASAWCWVGSDVDGGWSWEQRSAGCLAAFPDDFTHWLPAHALPLPEVGA